MHATQSYPNPTGYLPTHQSGDAQLGPCKDAMTVWRAFRWWSSNAANFFKDGPIYYFLTVFNSVIRFILSEKERSKETLLFFLKNVFYKEDIFWSSNIRRCKVLQRCANFFSSMLYFQCWIQWLGLFSLHRCFRSLNGNYLFAVVAQKDFYIFHVITMMFFIGNNNRGLSH